MLEIWTVYHFVGYDLQINLALEFLVHYVCGKLDSLYKFSIDIYRCACIQIIHKLKIEHLIWVLSRHDFRRQRRRRQHLRLKFACSLFYGSNSKSIQPIVLKPDSNDPVECLLSFESPCSAFHSGILIL